MSLYWGNCKRASNEKLILIFFPLKRIWITIWLACYGTNASAMIFNSVISSQVIGLENHLCEEVFLFRSSERFSWKGSSILYGQLRGLFVRAHWPPTFKNKTRQNDAQNSMPNEGIKRRHHATMSGWCSSMMPCRRDILLNNGITTWSQRVVWFHNCTETSHQRYVLFINGTTKLHQHNVYLHNTTVMSCQCDVSIHNTTVMSCHCEVCCITSLQRKVIFCITVPQHFDTSKDGMHMQLFFTWHCFCPMLLLYLSCSHSCITFFWK